MKKALFILVTVASLGAANPANAAITASVSSCGSLATSGTGGGLEGLAGCFLGFLSLLTVLLMAASVVYIVYGAFNMIRSEEKREEGKNTVIYGIIGLFVMVSIWGFVRILDSTFNLSSVKASNFDVPSLKPNTPNL